MLQHPTEFYFYFVRKILHGCKSCLCFLLFLSRMQLPQKWLKLFAGMGNEQYGTGYQEAPFLVSNKCCYYLKEKPCDVHRFLAPEPLILMPALKGPAGKTNWMGEGIGLYRG